MMKKGFTIVELLIVIVVIGILAAITIVAYGGIQSRSKAAAAQSATNQAFKKLATSAVDNLDNYPSSLATAGVTNTTDTAYQYTFNNATTPKVYCVSATTGGTSYYLNNTMTGGPAAGQCPITNLAFNPSLESNATTSWGGPNGSTIVTDTAQKYQGNYSIKVTFPTAGTGNVGVAFYNQGATVPTVLAPNTTYTASVWVYVPSGTIDLYVSAQGTGVVQSSGVSTTTKNAWSRISKTFTTGSSGTVYLYALNAANTTAGMQFYADAAMLTQGSDLYNYSDGSFTNWSWKGAANLSTSTGAPQ